MSKPSKMHTVSINTVLSIKSIKSITKRHFSMILDVCNILFAILRVVYINYSDEDSSGEDDVKVNSATYNTPRKVPLDDIKRKKYNSVR